MSVSDEYRSNPAAWLARARSEPEDALPCARWLSLSVQDIECLEEAVSGKSPRHDRPLPSAGSAALGGAEPVMRQPDGRGAGRTIGGRSGTVSGERDPAAERTGRRA